jgi:cobalamin biosynthetic protein CobC
MECSQLRNNKERDHGGGLDAAIIQFGGTRARWIDLSTGINPVPYLLPDLPADAWTALPDKGAQDRLVQTARSFWNVPEGAAVLAAPGASALIAQIPSLAPAQDICITEPTYNEHAAAFRAHGWKVTQDPTSSARVLVHPNNPTGAFWDTSDIPGGLTVIDESFCDIAPDRSLIPLSERPNTLILKSFGKFWGLAGLRLGFAIGDASLVARLAERLGPWPVAGPALQIGAKALSDADWARTTRARVAQDAARLDALLNAAGATVVGGTDLFRLYKVASASDWQERLARHYIWSRVFPYDSEWLRLGLPAPHQWDRLRTALA